jgi:hypothetical protein
MVKNERILRRYKVSGKLRRTSGVIKPPYNGARDNKMDVRNSRAIVAGMRKESP